MPAFPILRTIRFSSGLPRLCKEKNIRLISAWRGELPEKKIKHGSDTMFDANFCSEHVNICINVVKVVFTHDAHLYLFLLKAYSLEVTDMLLVLCKILYRAGRGC